MRLEYRKRKRTAQAIKARLRREAEKTNGTQTAGQELLQDCDGIPSSTPLLDNKFLPAAKERDHIKLGEGKVVEIQKELGEGGSGKVFLVTTFQGDGDMYVLKQVSENILMVRLLKL